MGGEGATDREHLLLAAGELPPQCFLPRSQLRKQAEGAVNAPRTLGLAGEDRNFEIFAHGKPWKHAPAFR